MIDLILVRHGESIRNHASYLAHHGDFQLLEHQLESDEYEPGWPLTETGWKQANAAGDWIRAERLELCEFAYVSPYFRTLQTARGLGIGCEFQQDWRLRERHWGDYRADAGYTVQQYLADLAHCLEPDWRSGLPGGESIHDLVPQVRSFVQERVLGLRSGKILAVSHGGTLRAMQLILQGEPTSTHDPHLMNCGVLHYQLESIRPDGRSAGRVRAASPYLGGNCTTDFEPFGNDDKAGQKDRGPTSETPVGPN